MSCLPNPEQFEVGVERLGLAAPDDFAAGHKGPPVNESLHVEIKPYFLYPDSDGKALFLRVRGRSHEQRGQAGVPLRPPLVGDRRRPISADGEGGKGRRGRLVRGSARRNEALPVAAAVAVGADWSFIDARAKNGPDLPKWRCRKGSGCALRSCPVSIPSRCIFAAVAGPTPWNFSTASDSTKEWPILGRDDKETVGLAMIRTKLGQKLVVGHTSRAR
jgi:hypothetical protein